jgi:hypothetical protein
VPLRREGRTSALAGATADELRRGVVAFELGTEREDALGARVLTLGGKLDPSREQQLLEVHEGIPSILWVVPRSSVAPLRWPSVPAGGENRAAPRRYDRRLHPRAGLILYTIRALDYPFDGLVRVGPDAFEAVPSKMEAYREGRRGGVPCNIGVLFREKGGLRWSTDVWAGAG